MARSSLEDINISVITDRTIRRMYELVDAGKTDERFQKLVYGLVNRQLPHRWKDYPAEIAAVFNWFKANHDYRRDPYGVELVHDVWATMDRKRFDCDDAAIWLGAAAEILGNPARFITVSTRPDGEPSHVYVEVYSGGAWVPLDASVQWSTPGWFPTGITARRVWTRESVGLSGADDELPVEGLGMRNDLDRSLWSNDGGYSERMRQVLAADGNRSDISRTYAHYEKNGAAFVSRRSAGRDNISQDADLMQQVESQGEAERTYPIHARTHPFRRNGLIPSVKVPRPYNPAAWTGSIPVAVPENGYLLPQKALPEGQYMTDLAGLRGLGITATGAAIIGATATNAASIASNLLATGQAPSVQDAIKAASSIAVAALTPQQRTVAAAAAPATTAPSGSSGASWAIPTGVLLAVGGVAAFMLLRKR